MTPEELIDEKLAYFCPDFNIRNEYLRDQVIEYMSRLPTEVFNAEVAEFLEVKNDPDHP